MKESHTESTRNFLYLENTLEQICRETHVEMGSCGVFDPIDIWKNDSLQNDIIIPNRVVRYNLILLDSRMPRLLLALASFASGCESIGSIAVRLSENGFPFPDKDYSKRYLRYKMVVFFEGLLYIDSLTKDWTGQFHTDRIYVTKNSDGQLSYFNHLQLRSHLFEIIDSIFMKGNMSKNICEVQFYYSKSNN